MIQAIWNIYTRDPSLFMGKAKRILGPAWKHWRPKPTKERDTRFGSNGEAWDNILGGFYVVNQEGVNFWVLLFMELRDYYSDFRGPRSEHIVKMFMNESLIAGGHLENDAGDHFNQTYVWLNSPGELCEKNGFKILELASFLFDCPIPYYESLHRDWRKELKSTAAYLDSLQEKADGMEEGDEEKKRLTDLIAMKIEQLETGIKVSRLLCQTSFASCI